ncbi:Crp/Fnr family transcriptional regulator [Robertkochia solimangrovi]|uniref:Crp/Fnr family transcriptional regulator n=1 Tax=Robertkochia solimangrovi TaxID=2213046 RepID=UPI00117D4229|nr:Crp/Fnr family transcriptional regulator [Robertkochia solimangrovi]TRZ45720.1 Crp/Fnr family transcriptional regulator [Robertkochia solimangrovi]
MANEFYNHITKFSDLSALDFRGVMAYFEPISLEKKGMLQIEGSVSPQKYFVVSGCLHMFFTDDQGVEKTVFFAMENWWIGDHLNFYKDSPSGFGIQAVETSEVLGISVANMNALLKEFPIMERYFRRVYEVGYGAALMRMKYIYDHSKEEIFIQFRKQFPEFVQRVPQYLLASFLGLTPEYLSKIRGKELS